MLRSFFWATDLKKTIGLMDFYQMLYNDTQEL